MTTEEVTILSNYLDRRGLSEGQKYVYREGAQVRTVLSEYPLLIYSVESYPYPVRDVWNKREFTSVKLGVPYSYMGDDVLRYVESKARGGMVTRELTY